MSIANLNPHVHSINGRTGDVVLTIDDFPGAGAVLSINGQVGNVSLTSANIPEGSNLYYTDARVQTFGDTRYARLASANIFTASQRVGPTAAATIGVPKNSYSFILSGASDVGLGSTNRSTIITHILAGGSPGLTFDVVDINGAVKTFIMRTDGTFVAPSGSIPSTHTHIASQITDFNEAVDDRINSLFVAGTGISFVYDDTANTFTINSSGGGAVSSVNGQAGTVVLTTTDIAEGTRLYYTDERVDDRVASLIQAANGLTWFYNDVLGTLTPTINLGSFSTTNLPEGSNLYYTNARVLAVAAPISHTHTLSQITDAGSAASKTAGNAVGNVPLVEAGGKLNPSLMPSIAITDTSVVASQAAMLALTAETGDIAVRSDTNQTYILKGSDPTVLANWELLRTPTDLVTSVNGLQGVVVLTTSNIAEGSNLYYTDERVDDRVAALIQAGGGITWTYNDASGTLTPAVTITSAQLSDFNTAVDARLTGKSNLAGGNAFTGIQTLTNADTAGLLIRSGNATKWSGLSVGRTATECNWGIAAAADQWFAGAVAGDVIYRIEDSTKRLLIGMGNASAAPDFIFAAGGLTLAGRQVNFGASGSNSPATSAGIKLNLWDSGSSTTSYALGVESNTLWLQTGGTQFKWYASNVQVGLLDSTGALTLGHNAASGSSIILNAANSSWYYNLQAGVNRFACGYRDTTNVYAFSRWTGSAFDDCFTLDRSTGNASFAHDVAIPSGKLTANNHVETIALTVGDGTNAITAGSKGFRPMHYAGTIVGWLLLSDSSAGDITIDVKKSSYASFPTTASVVGAGTKPNLSGGARKNTDSTLTSWTTSVAADDIFELEVTGTPTAKKVFLYLFIKRA